ncbi:MAG: hypothetical protein MK031_04655 [Alphaproteobacteria bacterium]|nr:hypothetical protein [Alphaproteobacteria bacterium]
MEFAEHLIRWFHVLSGVMWIGLLWYLNFVQVPTMPKIPDDLKPAIGKHIAPAVLFWFRWSAASTVLWGLILAWMEGYLGSVLSIGLTDGSTTSALLGIAMWFGLIMAFNVWFVIWPNQKIALGLIEVADDSAKPKAARKAMLFSRTNTLLSIPMLYGMVAFQNPPF